MNDDEKSMLNAEGEKVQDQNEGLNIDQIASEESNAADMPKSAAKEDDPYGIKKRLGMQAKKHQRELRQMQEQLAQMQAQMYDPNQRSYHPEPQNTYHSPGQPDAPAGSEQERIQRAVQMALQAQKHEEQRAQEAERMRHVHQQYQNLNNEFDKAADKYEDFDDVVRSNDAPFSSAIRDALLLIDNPAEVAYKLGKNRAELSRISQLHPLDQAREVNKLSFALMGGANGKSNGGSQSTINPMSNPRVNPVNPSAPTTAAAIRARMKSNTWK